MDDDHDFCFGGSSGSGGIGLIPGLIIIAFVLLVFWLVSLHDAKVKRREEVKDRNQMTYMIAHGCKMTGKVRDNTLYECDSGQMLETEIRQKANP